MADAHQAADPRTRRRAATEEALLDAFERVLARDGIRNLTVNAIAAEAAVGKPLLYRYFGDLPGLVRAWGMRRRFWPEPTAAAGSHPGEPADFRQRLTGELRETADYLRSHPVTLEFLAEELSARSDLSDAFAAVRADLGRELVRLMLTDSRYGRREHRRLIIVLYAAIAYLAMRSRRSPRFMGVRLDTAEGWADAMAMVEEVILAAPGPRLAGPQPPSSNPPPGAS